MQPNAENVLLKEIDTYLVKVLPVRKTVVLGSEQLNLQPKGNRQDLNTNRGSNDIRNIQNTQPQIIDYIPDDTTQSSMTILEVMMSDEPIPTTQASIFGKRIHVIYRFNI